MRSRSLLVLMGATAMTIGAVGCEREVTREERIERRNGEVQVEREVETVDPIRDERREVEEERREVVEPRD